MKKTALYLLCLLTFTLPAWALEGQFTWAERFMPTGPDLLEGVAFAPYGSPGRVEMQPDGLLRLVVTRPKEQALVASAAFACQGGKTYYLSCLVRHSRGALFSRKEFPGARAFVQWEGPAGALSPRVEIPLQYQLADFRRITWKVEAPKEAVAARVAFAQRGGSTTTHDVLEVKDVHFFPEPAAFTPKPVGEPCTLQGGLDFTAQAKRLALEVKTSALKQATLFEVTGNNLEARPRAGDLTFEVPIPGRGAVTWWDDMRTSRPCEVAGSYSNLVPADNESQLLTNEYPFGCVTRGSEGVAIGVTPSNPCVFQVSYESARRSLRITFPLGFVPEAKYQPNRAKVEFVVFTFPADEGFRGALASYYALFPEAFKAKEVAAARASGEALKLGVTGFRNLTPEENQSIGARSMQKGSLWNPRVARRVYDYCRTAHINLAFYMLPWTQEAGWGSKEGPPPTFEQALEAVKARYDEDGLLGAGPRSMPVSWVADTNGLPVLCNEMIASWAPDRWTVRFAANTDPEVPGGRGQVYLEWLDKTLKLADQLGGRIDALEFDNFFAEGDFLDCAPDHVKLATSPLTYSANTFQPALPVFASYVKFLEAVEEYLAATGRKLPLSGNCLADGSAFFGITHLAAMPFETGELRFNWGDAAFNWRRAIAWQRPVNAVDCTGFKLGKLTPEATLAHMQQYIDDCLLYGFHPGESKFLSYAGLTQEAVALLREVTPLFDQLTQAGWEPVTEARCDLPEVALERFGSSQGKVFLSVQNRGNTTVEAKVRLEAALQKDFPRPKMRELRYGLPVQVSGGVLKVRLEPGQTALLELTRD